MQARRFAALWRLQHILCRQRSCSLVSEGKGIFQELQDLGFGLQIRWTVAAHHVVGEFIAGQRRPDGVVGSCHVLDLHGKRPHTFVVAAGNAQAWGEKSNLSSGMASAASSTRSSAWLI